MSQPQRPKSHRRRHAFGNYLLLLALTGATYGLYLFLVVPHIEVAAVGKAPALRKLPEEFKPSIEHHRWFKNGDWETESCSILHTAHGKILFQDHQVENSTTWFVTPFSLVLQRDQEEGADGKVLPPLVLRCASGARLKFNSPIFTKLNSAGNRLENALLEGAVELYRFNSQEHVQDGLRIETSNVQISDQQILTIDDVAFWIGPNHGIGRNMRIDLTNSSPQSITRDFSRINGIRSLQLGFLSSLQIRPTRKAAQISRKRGRLLANDNAPIEITAAGPFDFDMETQRATFKEKVQVRKLDGSGDMLQCDDLSLQFASSDGSKSLKLNAAADTEFELQTITATGQPAVLVADSHDAQIQAQQLSYDLKTQVVRAESSEQVDIRQGSSRFLSPGIEYRLTDDNSIGSMVAAGPGMLIRRDTNESFRASWQKDLKIDRLSKQQQLVTLSGGASVKLDQQTAIDSDVIQFKVWQVPVLNSQNEVVDWEYQPGQLDATGSVGIQSEEMQGRAMRLVANWPMNPRAANQRMPDTIEPGADDPNLGNELQAGQRSFVRRVSYQEEMARQKRTKLKFNGQQIDVVLADANETTQLVELQINGNVTVFQQGNDQRRPTFEVRGHSLRMLPQAQELFQVTIFGQEDRDATLVSDQLQLMGPSIALDQQANRVWVNGAGSMVISPNDQISKTAPHADINFNGGMVFDGQKVYFERDVNATIQQPQDNGATQRTDAKAAAVSLELDQRIDLQKNQGAPKTDPQVVEMILKDRISASQNQFKLVGFAPVPVTTVVVDNQKYDRAGKLIERVKISALKTVFNEANKSITADGPGSVELVRLGGASSTGIPGISKPKPDGKKNGFTYIRSRFDRALTANTANNYLSITGNTRTVYAPIDNPNRSMDPDRPQSFVPDSIQLRCEQLDVTQTHHPYDGRLQSLMVATGNARISSDTFQTASDRIRYDEARDVMIVESASGRDVVLRSRQNARSPWKEIVNKRLTYQLSTQSALAEGVQRIQAPFNKRP